MPIDAETEKYAASLFDYRCHEEIIPAHRKRLVETRTSYPANPQLPFSGAEAQRLIELESLFAKEAAVAQVECLAAAVTKSGLVFDEEIFRKGLDDARALLEKHKWSAIRKVLARFSQMTNSPSADLKEALERDVDARMARIHDSVLSLLRVNLHDSAVTARTAVHQSTWRGSTSEVVPDSRLVFLSHAVTDQHIATYLKKVIQESVQGTDVFVSSDGEDLHPGDPWVETILTNLQNARMLLVLATNRGMSRPWVWYEAGAGWSRGLRIIPCCIGKTRKGRLAPPFSCYQSLNIDEEADLRSLLNSLAEQFGLPHTETELSTVVAQIRSLNEGVQAEDTTGISSGEIQDRIDAVELSVQIIHGRGNYFQLQIDNESKEHVAVIEIKLESREGHKLARMRPSPKDSWRIVPSGRTNIVGETQSDPATELARLHNWPQKPFETDLRIKFLCEILGKRRWIPCPLRVQVEAENRNIRQLVG